MCECFALVIMVIWIKIDGNHGNDMVCYICIHTIILHFYGFYHNYATKTPAIFLKCLILQAYLALTVQMGCIIGDASVTCLLAYQDQTTSDIWPTLIWCWATGSDAVPAANQHLLFALVCSEESLDSDGIATKKYAMLLEFARLRHITGHTHAAKQTLVKVTKYGASNIT